MKMPGRLDRLRNEALVILPADFLGMVGKADIEMGLEDQMHALFSHSISHIGDDSRNSLQPVAVQVRSVTVSTNTLAPAANAPSTVLAQIHKLMRIS